MSNRISIEPTEFTNVRTGEKSFGFRMFDDYDQCYDNTWESIPDDDMDVLRKVVGSYDEQIGTLIEHLIDNQKGIYIGQTWYDYDEIKDILEN